MLHQLIADSIIKSYNGKLVLSDIYLKCQTGDIIGIFGRNGCGKSTLLQILFGTMEAENSFIKIDSVVSRTPYMIKNGISYLPQGNFLPSTLTVLEAIKLFVQSENVEVFQRDELIKNNLKKNVIMLSGGELRYLQVKLLLYSSSKFCLLDEPFSGISPIIAERLNQLIIMQSSTKGIIITDHNYQNLFKIVNRIYILKDSKCHHLKSRDELVDYGYISESMIN